MKTFAVSATVVALFGVAYYTEKGVTTESSFLAEMREEEIEYMRFMAKHGRSYSERGEYMYRLGIFAEKYNFINEHNKGDSDFKLAVNHLTDFTHEEYKQLLGYKPKKMEYDMPVEEFDISYLSSSVNWVTAGKVSSV